MERTKSTPLQRRREQCDQSMWALDRETSRLVLSDVQYWLRQERPLRHHTAYVAMSVGLPTIDVRMCAAERPVRNGIVNI